MFFSDSREKGIQNTWPMLTSTPGKPIVARKIRYIGSWPKL